MITPVTSHICWVIDPQNQGFKFVLSWPPKVSAAPARMLLAALQPSKQLLGLPVMAKDSWLNMNYIDDRLTKK